MARRKNEPLRYPLTQIDDEADYLVMRIAQYVPPGINSNSGTPFLLNNTTKVIEEAKRKGRIRTFETIYLPIPENLADANTVKWDADQLDSLSGAAFAAASSAVQDINLDNANSLGDTISNAGKTLQSAYDALTPKVRGIIRDRLIAGSVNSLGANVNPRTLVSRANGQVLNPNLELLFQGVNLRNYQFQFTMTARSQAESLMIKKIINTLKKRMAAKTTTVATSGAAAGIFIGAPDTFQMEFKKGNRPHPFLFSMKPCALKELAVNYVGAGPYISYEDGTPVKIQLSMRFTELEPVYAEDYTQFENGDRGVGF